MSKKDYELVAATMRAARKNLDSVTEPDVIDALDHLAGRFCSAFKQNNPAFDQDAFLSAYLSTAIENVKVQNRGRWQLKQRDKVS